jgi:hypothetical protein
MDSLERLVKRHPKRVIIAAGSILSAWLAIWLVSATATAPIDSYLSCAFQGYPTTDTNPPLCSDGAHDYLGPPAPTPKFQAPLTTQTFNVLVDGDSRGTYPNRWQVITTQTGWVSYWNTVHAQLHAIPPLLPVNFATSNVIALSQGPEQTSGYVLQINDVTTSTAGSVIDISDSVPTIGCQVAYTSTNPYFIASTTKLPPPVTFFVTTTRRKC